jgi:hypothetical protein
MSGVGRRGGAPLGQQQQNVVEQQQELVGQQQELVGSSRGGSPAAVRRNVACIVSPL